MLPSDFGGHDVEFVQKTRVALGLVGGLELLALETRRIDDVRELPRQALQSGYRFADLQIVDSVREVHDFLLHGETLFGAWG